MVVAERLIDESKKYEVMKDRDVEEFWAEKMEGRGAREGVKKEQQQQQQQPPAPAQQRQPQLPAAAAPSPWPTPLSQEVQAAAIEQVGETEEKRTVVEVEKVMAFDGDKEMVESTKKEQEEQEDAWRLRGEKGWPDGLVMKLNYESNLSCSVGASAAEPIDVCARAGIGTRWMVATEDAQTHGHSAGEPVPPFGPECCR